ncbi:hypothetical protein ESY86_08785 [Subsaximicrobium wynnwilliamsii]|uniref:DUF4412 domain-containing protein n=1 Tax=Subsaximicrobium wynnwilliamsii TaxID=291179 RepID=A0A5C6ZI55_9FLAO|nr:hypothetical protein [Subsaximicrobium wynnwilliamsii]TXD83649.1 hypothetical protein ESY87_08420 [Subsaximicrobium wynnwilliamsii]TXD89466.1 hypothetical protein ESY86_08785 [Subsaximicrobium wynnwilliamsii]TXE03486.1 hypothetical protein ESY88_07445 [Subsaximicrobium wynnwilliamsii]
MKSLRPFLSTLLLLICFSNFAQTPEQQEMMVKAERMRDSIMNTPEMKAMMKQANELEKKQKSNVKTSPIPKAIKTEDKYWKNTLVSIHNNKLTNWNLGAADLVFNYSYDSRNDKLNSVKVGTIKADGTIALNPTSKVPDLKPLSNFKNSNVFFDIHDPASYQFTNEATGFKLNSYVLVYQNNQKIGVLTIGNSEKVTLNLLTSGDLYYGDEGYMLSWAYVEKDCAIKANEHWKGDLSNTGTPLIVETNVVYDLSFKTGWNLVKTEVIGKYEFPNAPEEDRSRYKKHKHTVVPSIPVEATYYFRKSLQY